MRAPGIVLEAENEGMKISSFYWYLVLVPDTNYINGYDNNRQPPQAHQNTQIVDRLSQGFGCSLAVARIFRSKLS
jgi:hypothetical protein